jgi:hypothetical protein
MNASVYLLLAMAGLSCFFAGCIVGQWFEARLNAMRAPPTRSAAGPRSIPAQRRTVQPPSAAPRSTRSKDRYEVLRKLNDATSEWCESQWADDVLESRLPSPASRRH